MATRTFQLAIDALYKGGGAFKKAQSDLKALERDGDKAASGVKRAWGGIGVAAGATVGALGAVALAGKAAWETLGEGAALEAARGRFDNLAESIGTTADALLGKMREATNGLISDANLISSGTDIISLGLAKTEDQAVRLASVVGQLGWDMQVVTLTMANNSKARLDSLGLSMEDVNARARALQETGYSLDEAFDMAVIEAGEAKIQLLGDASQTSAGKIQQLETIWENATNAFKEEFASSVVDQLAAVVGAVRDLGPGFEQGMGELGRQAGGTFGNVMAEVAAVGVQSLNQQLVDTLGLSQEVQRELFAAAREASGAGIFQFDGGEALRYQQTLNQLIEERFRAELEVNAALNARSEWEDWGSQVGAVTDLGNAYEWLINQYDKAAEAAAKAAGKEAAFQEWLKGRDREAEAVTGTGRAYEWLIGQYDAAAEAATTASEEQQKAADDAAAAAEENARRIAEAFQEAAAQASTYFTDAITGIQDWQIPDLITPERDVSYTVSGPSQDQLNLMEEYQARYDDAATAAYELSVGLGTVGLSQEQLNERVADANAEMAHYSGLMAGLQLPATQTATAHQALAFNMDMVNDAMYNAGVSAGWSVTQIADLGVASGQFTPQAADAAIKASIFSSALDILAQERKMGNLDTSGYTAAVQQLVSDLENNSVIDLQVKLAQVENPARELWAGLPAEERQPVEIPVSFTPEEAALKTALDTLDGIPDNDEKLITFGAVYEAVTPTATDEIQTAITAIDGTVTFEPVYNTVTPDATGAIQAGIEAIDGTVLMTPDAQAVYNTIDTLNGKHITIYVDYVETNDPESRSVRTNKRSIDPIDKNGSSYAADYYSSGAPRSGALSVNMTVNFHGPAEPAAVQRALYSGVEQLYADIAREGVSW